VVDRMLSIVMIAALVSGLATGGSPRAAAPRCPPAALIAHRGISPSSAENTMAAFENAYRLGFEVVETDVRISADDAFVLIHDDNLRRVAGRPDRVARLRTHELRGIRTRAGEQIPRLVRALRWAHRHRMRMVLHLKHAAERSWTPDRLTRLRLLVERTGMSGEVTYLSAHRRTLRAIETRDETARTAWLVDGRPGVAEAGAVADEIFLLDGAVLDAEYARALHRGGVPVTVSDVDRPTELERLVGAGVTSAVTDDLRPRRVSQALRRTRPCAPRQATV
jgi:glycerophosphoryl diester phosphodiesterase